MGPGVRTSVCDVSDVLKLINQLQNGSDAITSSSFSPSRN